jgi:hypothetical protein
MGLYNASIGARSNETSGVAISQRKQEGDVATFHFSDNLYKSITQVGRILIYAIPEVHDTASILRIMGDEDQPKQIGVNGELAENQEETIDLKRGAYDVRVVTGASYTTLRQESVAALQSIFQASPDLMAIMGDLYFKYSDFAGAQAMASRMKKFVDPKFLEEEDKPEEQQQAPDPEKQQMVAIIQEGQSALQQMTQEIEALKGQLQNKQGDLVIKSQEMQLKERDIEIKRESLALDAYKIQSEVELKNKELEAEIMKAKLEAKASVPADVALLDPLLNDGSSPMADIMAQFSQSIKDGLMAVAQSQVIGNQAVLEQLAKPKQIIRDQSGKIAGVQ